MFLSIEQTGDVQCDNGTNERTIRKIEELSNDDEDSAGVVKGKTQATRNMTGE